MKKNLKNLELLEKRDALMARYTTAARDADDLFRLYCDTPTEANKTRYTEALDAWVAARHALLTEWGEPER